MTLTETMLRECMPYASPERIATFAGPLNEAMAEFGITTYVRQAMFLAQAAHESGSLRYTREIADGSAYEGRSDLGNTQPGDGRRFRGRGLFQVTGRANYLACGNALGLDLIAQPELLELPVGACRSAGWFWQSRNLSGFADARKFGTLSRAINGGYNGLDDRIEHYLRASRVLGIA